VQWPAFTKSGSTAIATIHNAHQRCCAVATASAAATTTATAATAATATAATAATAATPPPPDCTSEGAFPTARVSPSMNCRYAHRLSAAKRCSPGLPLQPLPDLCAWCLAVLADRA
jgi:hypothetical protein